VNRSGWEQEGIRPVAQEAWTLIAETRHEVACEGSPP